MDFTITPPTPPDDKPKRGRKPKPDARSKQLNMRMSDQEWAELDSRAQAASLHISVYARSLLTMELPKAAKSRAAADAPELARMLGMLAIIRDNIQHLDQPQVLSALLDIRHYLLMALSGEHLAEITDKIGKLTASLTKLAEKPDFDPAKIEAMSNNLRIITNSILKALSHDDHD